MDKPFQWSFRNHVESVLSKQGCNGGACHGARAGQKGFRLTLFGFDVDADYTYLTRQAVGRRIVPTDPGRSLILTKPTGLLPHKGGVQARSRVAGISRAGRMDCQRRARAAGRRSADRAAGSAAEVFTAGGRSQTQQLVVLAHFSDGHVEDATRWAKYTSANARWRASMSAAWSRSPAPAKAAIKVWYLNHNAMAYLTVPYPNKRPAASVYRSAERRNFIDDQVLAKLAGARACRPRRGATTRRSSAGPISTRSARCRPPTKRGRFWPMPPPTSATG